MIVLIYGHICIDGDVESKSVGCPYKGTFIQSKDPTTTMANPETTPVLTQYATTMNTILETTTISTNKNSNANTQTKTQITIVMNLQSP